MENSPNDGCHFESFGACRSAYLFAKTRLFNEIHNTILIYEALPLYILAVTFVTSSNLEVSRWLCLGRVPACPWSSSGQILRHPTAPRCLGMSPHTYINLGIKPTVSPFTIPCHLGILP